MDVVQLSEQQKLREHIKSLVADENDAIKHAEAWTKRARALHKIRTGYEDLMEAGSGPAAQVLSLAGASIPVPTPEPLPEEAEAEADNVTLNDAVERALMVAGPRGATLGAIWDFAKHVGAKTKMADTERATQFAIANLRKKGLKITRFPSGSYVLLGRLAKDMPPEIAAAQG